MWVLRKLVPFVHQNSLFKSTAAIIGSLYKPPVDRDLVTYIDEVKEALRLQSPKNQAITLAR